MAHLLSEQIGLAAGQEFSFRVWFFRAIQLNDLHLEECLWGQASSLSTPGIFAGRLLIYEY